MFKKLKLKREDIRQKKLIKMAANRRKKPGDEVVKNGEVFVIVSDDISIPYVKRRVPKRRVVWEQHFGPIPKTHMVIHLDGNKLNCDIDNLYCIPKKI